MGFGPFLSQEEKNNINNSLQQNYAPKMGPPIPKVQVPTGGRSAIRAEEIRRSREAAKTPYVPPASKPSRKERKGGVARPTGGIQIGVPQSSPISTQRPNRSSNTTTETPTQNPPRPVGVPVPAFSYYDQARKANPDGGTRNFGEGYKEQELAAGQIAENHRAGSGFGGQTRVSPTGVVQKGTNTSPPPMTMDDAGKLLSGGYKIENPYSSNQLPTTASSPYAGKGNAQIYNPDTLHQHTGDVDYVSLSKNLFEDRSGLATYERGKNMKADYKQMDVNPGESVPEEKINWANRTMADNSDEKVRRRSAMLDDAVDADGNPLGIMQRMRNQEAIQGRVYAGGKHYQRNKDAGQEGQNDFVEISAGQARARSNYTKTADEVFANHLGKAKENTSGADLQTVSQDVPAMLPGAVPGQTPMDKSPFDTQDLMQQKPGKSIIGNNTPYTSTKKGSVY